MLFLHGSNMIYESNNAGASRHCVVSVAHVIPG